MHKSEIEDNFKKQKNLVAFFSEFKKGGFETSSAGECYFSCAYLSVFPVYDVLLHRESSTGVVRGSPVSDDIQRFVSPTTPKRKREIAGALI
jgi:hypothetical protein